MKVLITGTSGHIGSSISKTLGLNHEIIGLDVKPGPFTSIVGNITHSQLVDKLCSQVDAVIHTAALHAPHVGNVPKNEFQKTNIYGTHILLQASLQGSVKRFIYTSTTSLYGDALIPREKAVWVTENTTPIPRDIYDETKIAAEKECFHATQSGLTCISLRISRCFPEPERLMAIYRLHRGVDSRDVATAHELALLSDIKGFHIFNISAETQFQQEDTRELYSDAGNVLLKYYPWAEMKFAKREWQLPKSIDRVYVIEKAQKILGYKPKYNFDSMFNQEVS